MDEREIATLRRGVLWSMKLDRGGQYASCDICGENRGTDMHEIITRQKTQNNDEAQILSYNKHICALLCNDCHVQKSLATINEHKLLLQNMQRYGRQSVLDAIKAVEDKMFGTLYLDIPDYTEQLHDPS